MTDSPTPFALRYPNSTTFDRLDAARTDKGISRGARQTLSFLVQRAGTSGRCFWRQEKIAEALGVHPVTIRKHISELASKGRLKVVRKGPYKAGEMFLPWHPEWSSLEAKPAKDSAFISNKKRAKPLHHDVAESLHQGGPYLNCIKSPYGKDPEASILQAPVLEEPSGKTACLPSQSTKPNRPNAHTEDADRIADELRDIQAAYPISSLAAEPVETFAAVIASRLSKAGIPADSFFRRVQERLGDRRPAPYDRSGPQSFKLFVLWAGDMTKNGTGRTNQTHEPRRPQSRGGTRHTPEGVSMPSRDGGASGDAWTRGFNDLIADIASRHGMPTHSATCHMSESDVRREAERRGFGWK